MATVWDVCVLGAGPAGYAAAMRAHDLGKRVLLVERDRVGGAGIHAGALSSKTMWHLSNDYAVATLTDRGYHAPGGIEVDYASVIACVRTAINERRSLLDHQLEQLSRPGDHGGVVAVMRGDARFVATHALEFSRTDGTRERSEATNFIIATDSRPRVRD